MKWITYKFNSWTIYPDVFTINNDLVISGDDAFLILTFMV